jgi:potassium inwardly-rectifying channel subfamily J
VTKEGEIIPFYQQKLNVGSDGEDDKLMFLWPTTIIHKINEKSPLYLLSVEELVKERFEIVVMLEGIVESTGMMTQLRSSYLPNEILWSRQFNSTVCYRNDSREYEVP